jgi:hypothetical protein
VVVVFAVAVFVPQAAVAQAVPLASQPERARAVPRAAQLVVQGVPPDARLAVPLASQPEQVRAVSRVAQLVVQGDPPDARLVPDALLAVHSGASQADLRDAR